MSPTSAAIASEKRQASRRQEPVFGLLKRDAEVRVILPPNCSERHLLGAILDNLDNVELDSIVYSDGCKADNRLSINGFHHKRIIHEKTLANGKGPINGPESSRGYGKRRLKAYNGGFIRNDSLFRRERPSASAIATTKTR